jgi:3,4-dihydroxy 2-butanone 4-phosphate synthase/GTP cyclohydrolase II
VVVLDAADRENEGDLIMAADAATPEWLALFCRHGSGYICAPMSHERADDLRLPLMVARGEESLGTAFTVTVDARHGISTGISAADRSRTLALLADPSTVAADLVRPGHVLPLRAHPGGLQARPGHTEAAVELTRLAGRGEVGVIVELVEDDGSMRRGESCRRFADEHGLLLITIADIRAHLGARLGAHLGARLGAPAAAPAPQLTRRVSQARLPTGAGEFNAVGYRDSAGTEHMALVLGDVGPGSGPSDGSEPVLVRVHSECLTGDVFGSARCDCGPQLSQAMAEVAAAGRGVIVYLCGHEGRGIGLAAKLAAYRLQDTGRDTVDANLDLGLPVDGRDYAVAAQILADLGVGPVTLLTNNPAKVADLRRHGVDVRSRRPIVVAATPESLRYLEAKRRRMGHDLPARAELEVAR